MLSEAYEYFGCNTADVFVISVNTGNTNAECIQFDLTYGVEFPCISGVEGGGTLINNTYGIGAYPTYILIAPDHSIVEQDIWPVPSAQTFISTFEGYDISEAECGGTLTASFSSDVTEICQYNTVSYTDNSSGDIVSWNWTFEGGDPATSTEQNPVVTYNSVGSFDVELEVGDGTTTNNLFINDYVDVLMTPPAMLQPFNDVCEGWPAFELTGGSPVGGEYSGPGVDNGWFDPAVAGLGTHTIYYTYMASNGCFNTADNTILVDPCTSINKVADNSISIFPNPTHGLFEIQINHTGNIDIQIYSLLGKSVFRKSINTNGDWSENIDLSGNEEGIYFISVQTSTDNIVRKINLIK